MDNEGRKPIVTWERAITVIIVLALFIFVQINEQNSRERAAQEKRELERQSTPPPGAVDRRDDYFPGASLPEYRPNDEEEDNVGVGVGDPSPKNCDEVTAPIPTPPGDPEGLDRDGDGKACEWK